MNESIRFGHGLIALASVLAFHAGNANAALIASQDFNALDSSSNFTADVFASGSSNQALTNSGASNSGGGGLDFASFWTDTRGNEGPKQGAESGDFIGVNSFAGSNSPNVAADGTSVSAGLEHNYEFNDGDGRIDLQFAPVDVSGFSDRQLSFDYWINNTGFESTDSFTATLSDGVNSQAFINFGETELEANVSADDGTANWKSVSVDIDALISGSGFGPNLSLSISADTNSGSENIFVDNILFESDATPAPAATAAEVYEIQGAGHTSPLSGEEVVTSGVVTAVGDDGFYIQDPTGDGDDATSDGVFVFTGTTPTVAVNDAVSVTGTVGEFFEETQINSVTDVTVTGAGSIAPITISTDSGTAGTHRTQPNTIIDDNGAATFDPTTDGRDFYESLEGMLVTLPNAQAVSDEDTRPSRGEFYAVSTDNIDGNLNSLNSRGGITITEDTVNNATDNPLGADLNPERILINGSVSGDERPATAPEMGDLVANDGNGITGVVTYSFNDYRITPLSQVTTTEVSHPDEVTALTTNAQSLNVATFNVLNLDPNDADGDTDIGNGRFGGLAGQIVNNLGAPGIVALQEIQDNSGSDDDGTIAANTTLQTLADEIVAAGGPAYAFIDNTFISDGESGGQPGGNIRTAFFYDPTKVTVDPASIATIDKDGSITDTPSADLQTDPSSPFFDARLSLVVEFDFNGELFTIINNHFSSKGGSDPLFGSDQPPANGSVDERNAQAAAVNAAVDSLLATDSDANIIVLGDFNEFQFYEPLQILAGLDDGSNVLINLSDSAADLSDVFTFEFEGNSQALDHILVSRNVFEMLFGVDWVHLNAGELFETLVSDHDPILAQFSPNGSGATVPVPATLPLLGLALFGMVAARRARRAARDA